MSHFIKRKHLFCCCWEEHTWTLWAWWPTLWGNHSQMSHTCAAAEEHFRLGDIPRNMRKKKNQRQVHLVWTRSSWHGVDLDGWRPSEAIFKNELSRSITACAVRWGKTFVCFNRRGVNVCLFVTSAIWCMCFVDWRAQPGIGKCLEMTGSVFFFCLDLTDNRGVTGNQAEKSGWECGPGLNCSCNSVTNPRQCKHWWPVGAPVLVLTLKVVLVSVQRESGVCVCVCRERVGLGSRGGGVGSKRRWDPVETARTNARRATTVFTVCPNSLRMF